MAEIVLGVGSSHTPQLSTSAADWHAHAARDVANPALLGTGGRYRSYGELLADAGPGLAPELTAEVFEAKFARAQSAIEVLGRALAQAEPDVVVVIGDDQHELFRSDGVPAIGLFLGDELVDVPPVGPELERIPPDIRLANWAAHADTPDAYPVDAELSAQLATGLTRSGFDLTVLSEQPAGRSLGHAFTFVRRRLHLARQVPIVPVLLNTYFPPNVPSPGRCYRLGQALRGAVEADPSSKRVAVVASGGLSHFVVLEDLDRRLLGALAAHDAGALSDIDPLELRSGTSEGLNWIAAGGALEHLDFDLVDYVPAYRSPAGTGVGMAFALWRPASQQMHADTRQGAAA